MPPHLLEDYEDVLLRIKEFFDRVPVDFISKFCLELIDQVI